MLRLSLPLHRRFVLSILLMFCASLANSARAQDAKNSSASDGTAVQERQAQKTHPTPNLVAANVQTQVASKRQPTASLMEYALGRERNFVGSAALMLIVGLFIVGACVRARRDHVISLFNETDSKMQAEQPVADFTAPHRSAQFDHIAPSSRPSRADGVVASSEAAAVEAISGRAVMQTELINEAIEQLAGEDREKAQAAHRFLALHCQEGEVQTLMRAAETHSCHEARLALIKLLASSGRPEVLQTFRRLAVRGNLPAELRAVVM